MEIEFRYRFEAAHRFLHADSEPCMTPHGHSWYASLGLQFVGSKLNSAQMTVEFSEIKKEWKALTQNLLDHSYLHNVDDPIVPVLKSGPSQPRLLPFPGDPTTELIALLLFQKMATIIENGPYADLVQVKHICVEETPTNRLTCGRAFYSDQIGPFSEMKAWWNSSQLDDRSFQ